LAGYQEVLAAYERERPLYVDLVDHAVMALQAAINAAGLHTLPVSGRAKEARSFAIKACVGRRYDRPLEQITDKAGVRVMVIYQRDLDRVVEIVRRTFTVLSVERKLDALDYDRNGYLGTHIQARLTAEQVAATRAELNGLEMEVQVRTLAQSAWAEVSHAELYKPAADVPVELKRRIYRLVGLVELIDNEVEAFCAGASDTEGYRDAAAVSGMVESMASLGNSRAPDRRLTRELCAAIVPLYGTPPGEVTETVEAFVAANQTGLRNVIREGELLDDQELNPLLAQPEMPMICERLERDRIRLEQAWPPSVPEDWLQDLAEKWGAGRAPG
jgi:putative GTP pyrophosphokinase